MKILKKNYKKKLKQKSDKDNKLKIRIQCKSL